MNRQNLRHCRSARLKLTLQCMNRRTFLASSSAAGLALTARADAADPPKRALMKLGCQSAPTNETHLKYFARYGVRNICGYPEIADGRLYATVEELKRMRDLAEKNGITIDCVAPPFLASSHIDRDAHPAIMLAQSPERDRDIESIQTLIRNCAPTGMPSIKYNMSILGVLRTGRTPGRGDATYSTWSLQGGPAARRRSPRPAASTPIRYWERITYFLERVIPVAERVQGPHGLPPARSRRAARRLSGRRRRPRHGRWPEEIRHDPGEPVSRAELLPGTVSEMLADPGKEIYDVIRYFGSRKKIFNVHFRNIRGHRDDFVEVYPGRRRHRFRQGHAGLQRGRLSLHADAGPRARRRPATPAACSPSPSATATSGL